jgi:hypothetical protein
MIRKTAMIIALVGLSACTDSDGAHRTAENHGLTNIRITGYRFFGCSDEDVWRTGFEASSPNGRRVTGVVCSALFKSNTLRLD